MRCNGCWTELEADVQCVASACGHLYCVNCAKSIIESDAACPICSSPLSKSNIKLVNVEQDQGKHKLTLCGQTPDTIMSSALAAVSFFIEQQRVVYHVREQQLEKKLEKTNTACKQKLQQVHDGYTKAKKRYEEAVQAKNAMEADNQELQEKYAQKSQQNRKLQEMLQKVQQENDMLRANPQARRNSLGGQFNASPGGMHGMGLGQASGNRVLTTVHRKQVFVPGGHHISPGMPGMVDAGSKQFAPNTGFHMDRRPSHAMSDRMGGLPDRIAMSPLGSSGAPLLQDRNFTRTTPQQTSLRQLLGGGSGGGGGGGRFNTFGSGNPRYVLGSPGGTLASL